MVKNRCTCFFCAEAQKVILGGSCMKRKLCLFGLTVVMLICTVMGGLAAFAGTDGEKGIKVTATTPAAWAGDNLSFIFQFDKSVQMFNGNYVYATAAWNETWDDEWFSQPFNPSHAALTKDPAGTAENTTNYVIEHLNEMIGNFVYINGMSVRDILLSIVANNSNTADPNAPFTTAYQEMRADVNKDENHIQFMIKPNAPFLKDLLGYNSEDHSLSKPLTVTFMKGYTAMDGTVLEKTFSKTFAENAWGETVVSGASVSTDHFGANISPVFYGDKMTFNVFFSGNDMFDKDYAYIGTAPGNEEWFAGPNGLTAETAAPVMQNLNKVMRDNLMIADGEGENAESVGSVIDRLGAVPQNWLDFDVRVKKDTNKMEFSLAMTDAMKEVFGVTAEGKIEKDFTLIFRKEYTSMSGKTPSEDLYYTYRTDKGYFQKDGHVVGYALKAPNKSQYKVGEKFAPEGGVVYAIRANTTDAEKGDFSKLTKVCDLTSDMVSGYDISKEGTTVATVTYNGQKIGTFELTVIPEDGFVFTSLEVDNQKTSYYAGEMLDLDQLTFTAVYVGENGQERKDVLSADEVVLSADQAQDAEGKQVITVSYGGKKAEFTIDVSFRNVNAVGVLNWIASADTGMHLFFDQPILSGLNENAVLLGANAVLSEEQQSALFDHIYFNGRSLIDIYVNALDLYGNATHGIDDRGAVYVQYKTIDGVSEYNPPATARFCLEIWVNSEIAPTSGGLRSDTNYLEVKQTLRINGYKADKSMLWVHQAAWAVDPSITEVPEATDPDIMDEPFGVNMKTWHVDGTRVGVQIVFNRIVRPGTMDGSYDLLQDDWFLDGFLFNGVSFRQLKEYAHENIEGSRLSAFLEKTNVITIWMDTRIPETEGGIKKDAEGKIVAEGNSVKILANTPLGGDDSELLFENENTEFTYKGGMWTREYDQSGIEWKPVDIISVGNPHMDGTSVRIEVTFSEDIVTKQYFHMNGGSGFILSTNPNHLSQTEIEKLVSYGIFDAVLDKIVVGIEAEGYAYSGTRTVREWLHLDVEANWGACVLNVHFWQQTGPNTVQLVFSGDRLRPDGSGLREDQPICPPLLGAKYTVTFKEGFRSPGFYEIKEDVTYTFSGKSGDKFERVAKVYDTVTIESVSYNGVEIVEGGRLELPKGVTALDPNLFYIEFKEGDGIAFTVAGGDSLIKGDNTITIQAVSGQASDTFTFTAVCTAAEETGGCGSSFAADGSGFAIAAICFAFAFVLLKKKKA